MISFIGMILGLLLFVVLAFKGFNLILSAVASSCLMFVFSGISILDGLKEFYLPGLAGFLQSYFLLFFLSALMGKLMSDGGNAKKIALSLSGLIKKSKNNQKFFCVLLVPVLYFILCYVGISGFVVVFTVLPIAKTIYEETDTPWRLYCCAGAQTVSAAYLPVLFRRAMYMLRISAAQPPWRAGSFPLLQWSHSGRYPWCFYGPC